MDFGHILKARPLRKVHCLTTTQMWNRETSTKEFHIIFRFSKIFYPESWKWVIASYIVWSIPISRTASKRNATQIWGLMANLSETKDFRGWKMILAHFWGFTIRIKIRLLMNMHLRWPTLKCWYRKQCKHCSTDIIKMESIVHPGALFDGRRINGTIFKYQICTSVKMEKVSTHEKEITILQFW